MLAAFIQRHNKNYFIFDSVLIPYIILLFKPFLGNKTSIFEEYGAFKILVSVQ